MATIPTLAPGESKKFKAVYKVKETDMGRSNVGNTVTVKYANGYTTGSSAYVTMDTPREMLSATKTLANAPANGSEYVECETVKWSIDVENTGNQSLSVRPQEKLAGATLEPSKVDSLAPGDTAKFAAAYVVQRGDLGRTLTNTVSVDGINSKDQVTTVSAKSDPVNVEKASLDISLLSWTAIKAQADACAAGNGVGYEDWIGATKKVSSGLLGDFTMRIKDLNAFDKASGGKAGFYFESDELVSMSVMGTSKTAQNYWAISNVNGFGTTAFNNLPEDLQKVISEISLKYCTGIPTGSNSVNLASLSEKIFIPSYSQVFGTASRSDSVLKAVPNEGAQLRWYANHDIAAARMKHSTNSNESSAWWIRTPYKSSDANIGYAYFAVDANGNPAYYTCPTSLGFPICFCI